MKTLIIVDAQNDFCPGGSLAVTNGDEIFPFINSISEDYDLVILTKDEHPLKMEAFASYHKGKQAFENYTKINGETDILWPDHCIEGTFGNKIHSDLDFSKFKEHHIFLKGQSEFHHPYSGFSAFKEMEHRSMSLARFLKFRDVKEIDIAGLATDFCVKDTALDGISHGFKVNVLLDGCRGISEDLSETYEILNNKGVKLI